MNLRKLPWLWLNEAADMVAERFAAASPQKFSDAAYLLDYSREELLGWANRGALEVQGNHWWIPAAGEEETPHGSCAWTTIDAFVWSIPRRGGARRGGAPVEFSLFNNTNNSLEFQIPGIYVFVDWENNSLTIDGNDISEPYGYNHLRIRGADIDQIIPGSTDTGTNERQADRIPLPRNPGGAPRKFRDDLLLEIIRIANGIDGLPPENEKAELKKRLRKYSDKLWGDEAPSDSTIDQIVSLVYHHIRAQKP